METITKNFWKLFQFDNRIKDELANFFSITDGFLWRRDLTRIVAIQIPVPQKGHFDYSMREIAKATIKKMDIKEDMKIEVETTEGKVLLEPMQRTQPNSLKVALRKNQEFRNEVTFDLKELKRIMMICEQKWLMDKEEDPKIIFDFNVGKIKMPQREEEFDIPFVGEPEKKDFDVSYSFYLMKDMLYNKFKDTISLRISEFYTIIQYEEQAYGVLMHCQ